MKEAPSESTEILRVPAIIEELNEQKNLALQSIVARQKEGEPPIIDFTKQEAMAFVPESLLKLPEIDVKGLTVRTTKADKREATIIYIHEGETQLIELYLSTQIRKTPEWNTLTFEQYTDHGKIRGKGVTRDFFKNAYIVAKQMGVRYISARHHADNITYFVQQFGSYPLNTLKKSFFEESGEYDRSENYDMFYYVITFLKEEDKEKYVKPYYLKSDTWRKSVKYSTHPQYYDEWHPQYSG